MTRLEIARRRLYNERLVGPRFSRAEEVVSWLGAVQAQDYPGARWGIGQRMQNATSAQVDEAFNAGKILRTHVLRPTWHLVMPGRHPLDAGAHRAPGDRRHGATTIGSWRSTRPSSRGAMRLCSRPCGAAFT